MIFYANRRVDEAVVMVGSEKVDYTLRRYRVPRWCWLPRSWARLPPFGRWETCIELVEAPPVDMPVAVWYETEF